MWWSIFLQGAPLHYFLHWNFDNKNKTSKEIMKKIHKEICQTQMKTSPSPSTDPSIYSSFHSQMLLGHIQTFRMRIEQILQSSIVPRGPPEYRNYTQKLENEKFLLYWFEFVTLPIFLYETMYKFLGIWKTNKLDGIFFSFLLLTFFLLEIRGYYIIQLYQEIICRKCRKWFY